MLNSLQTVSEDIYENIFDAVAAKEKMAEINEISTEVIDGDIEKIRMENTALNQITMRNH